MAEKIYSVLFLCSANSARSIMAEALLRHWGGRRFRVASAGSAPSGTVHPMALELLSALRFPVEDLRSKSWLDFAGADAEPFDFAFTVCEKTAGEPMPAIPGPPMRAHWPIPDPVAVTGSEVDRKTAFRTAFIALENRIKIFSALNVQSLDRLALQAQVDDIGRGGTESSASVRSA